MNGSLPCSAIALTLLLATSAHADGTATGSWTLSTPSGNETAAPLVKRGEEAYRARCNLCHGRLTKDASPGFGARMSGTEALATKYGDKKPAVLEDRTDLTADVVKYYVRHGAGIMPFLRKTELSDADLDAIAAYLTRKGRDRAKR
jgi:mono/diheme cytochrome c family protein